MKPYASYKPSGVPWLGDVPSHWCVNRLKEICSLRPSNVDKLTVEGQASVKLCNYVDVYKNERITSAIEFMDASATEEQIEKLSLKRGDVVVTKDSESPWDIAVPTVIAEDIQGLVCGYHLTKLEPMHAQGDYLAWGLRCYQVNLHFALSANGITRYGLGSSALADGNIPVPPSDEQQAIADYLDVETARIDTLIHEKNELIGLLREWRHSMLVETLTHGVDMSGDLINSNIYWLGDVPSKWKIKTLFQLNVHIETGKVDVNIQQEDGDYPFFTCGREIKRASQYSFDCEALLIAGNGEVGFTNYYNGKFEAYQRTYVLSNFVEADPNYLAYYVKTFLKQAVVAESNGSVIQFITLKDLRHFKVLLPPLSEQLRAVQLLNKSLTNIDELITHTNEEIVLLEELRAATIADVVLGRIDVRPK